MFYRIHASIINIFLQNPDSIDYDLIEEYLDRAEKSPFGLGVNIKSTEKISKDEPSQGAMVTLFVVLAHLIYSYFA